jgi:hypothetical protein
VQASKALASERCRRRRRRRRRRRSGLIKDLALAQPICWVPTLGFRV